MNTTTKNLSIAGLGLIASLAIGCSTWKKGENVSQPTTPTPAAVDAAAQVNASHVAEVRFDKNSHSLNESGRESLAKAINEARAHGTIDDIKVVAWADKEYPTAEQKKLTKRDRDLAGKRADAIKEYLKKDLEVSDVDTYNMASRPNAASKLFETSDTRVKGALESAGIPQTGSNAIATTVSGKASSAVVMIIMK